MPCIPNGEGFKEGFKNFFVIRFDQAFKHYGTWENKKNTITANETAAEGLGKGAYVQFKGGARVQVKVASSYISLEQAELNLSRELLADKSLEVTKARATANFIRHSDIVKGGLLKLEMSGQPELSRGLAESDQPFSLSQHK